MEIQNLFKRYEIKYLLGKRELDAVTSAFPGRMIDDEYGETTVCSLYFDTLDCRIIRRSLEKPFYKEKLRLRSYGAVNDDGTVFIELKKKYDSVVYKRREKMSLITAEKFLSNPDTHSQIASEIAYFLSFYPDVEPKTFIGCRRQAYYGANDRDLRITFDKDIVWRNHDLDLRLGRKSRDAGRQLSDGNKDGGSDAFVACKSAGGKQNLSHVVFKIRQSLRKPAARNKIRRGNLWVTYSTVFSAETARPPFRCGTSFCASAFRSCWAARTILRIRLRTKPVQAIKLRSYFCRPSFASS